MKRRILYVSIIAALLIVPLALIIYKLYVLDYPFAALVPSRSYEVALSMEVDGHGDDISITTFLPVSGQRQSVDSETSSSGPFALSIAYDGLNRVSTWEGKGINGKNLVTYSFSVKGKHVRYIIPASLAVPTSYPPGMEEYLKAEDGIQKDDALIKDEVRRLFPEGKLYGAFDVLKRTHEHLQNNFKNVNFSGYTDAVTALKLKEASCNGKSRLFAAIVRSMNIPARLAGGLILEQGSKSVSHQWVEAYVNGHWVPFDTINDKFAELPANYLRLYTGDKVLFKHTPNVNFRYFYKMTNRLVPEKEALAGLETSKLNIINMYATFEKIGISQGLLKIILMIPFGALVTVIFRNVIGLETFGTFLPALIAAAARETGAFWGIVGFVVIIVGVSLVRKLLDYMRLLHSPKMGVMLTTVVISLLALTVFGVKFGLLELAHITLFPIAILAITAERFALISEENGQRKAFTVLASTIVVVAACYYVMDFLFLQSVTLAFPEILLSVMALYLWLGKWMGIRVLEFYRFRRLIFGGGK